jgi:hypothetical protein
MFKSFLQLKDLRRNNKTFPLRSPVRLEPTGCKNTKDLTGTLMVKLREKFGIFEIDGRSHNFRRF